jgi:hypothetical protein
MTQSGNFGYSLVCEIWGLHGGDKSKLCGLWRSVVLRQDTDVSEVLAAPISGLWRSVMLWQDTDVSEVLAVSVLTQRHNPEDFDFNRITNDQILTMETKKTVTCYELYRSLVGSIDVCVCVEIFRITGLPAN